MSISLFYSYSLLNWKMIFWLTNVICLVVSIHSLLCWIIKSFRQQGFIINNKMNGTYLFDKLCENISNNIWQCFLTLTSPFIVSTSSKMPEKSGKKINELIHNLIRLINLSICQITQIFLQDIHLDVQVSACRCKFMQKFSVFSFAQY